MKKIKLSEADVQAIIKDVVDTVRKQVEDYEDKVNDTSLTIKYDFVKKADQKIKILFTPQAYLRSLELVKSFASEIGWYGLIRRVSPLVFEVYDILVCKQQVNGARVVTEDQDAIEFFESLTDEQAEFIHFQAHSHVNMATTASTVDLDNQASTIQNMGNQGFFLFQIWNKNLDINSYLYDLDNNILYDRNDVEIIVEDSEYGSSKDFVDYAKSLTSTLTYTPAKQTETKRYSWEDDDYSGYSGYGYNGYTSGSYGSVKGSSVVDFPAAKEQKDAKKAKKKEEQTVLDGDNPESWEDTWVKGGQGWCWE